MQDYDGTMQITGGVLSQSGGKTVLTADMAGEITLPSGIDFAYDGTIGGTFLGDGGSAIVGLGSGALTGSGVGAPGTIEAALTVQLP